MLKSRQITYEIADKIVAQIVSSFMEEKEKQHKIDCTNFAERVYADVYKKHLEAMTALPEGYLPTRGSFAIQFSEASEGYTRLYFENPKRVLDKDLDIAAKVYDEGSLYSVEFFNLKLVEQNLRQEKKDLCIKIRAVVNSHNTTKQLKDAWPEIKKYVEPYEKVPEKRQSLAPIITDLNKKLNLGE